MKGKMSKGIQTLLVCLAFGIISFGCLIYIAKKATGNYDKAFIAVSLEKDVPKNTEITKDNVNSLFRIEEMNANMKTKDSITNLDDLIGFYANEDIHGRETLTKSSFTSETDIKTKFSNPDIASFSVTSFSNAVSGVIRKGDYVNIYSYNQTTQETILVLQNVYVDEVFTSAGEKIKPDDLKSVATSFNVIIENDQETQFYQDISNNTVFVIKTKNK